MSDRKLFRLIVDFPVVYGTDDDIDDYLDLLPSKALLTLVEIKQIEDLPEDMVGGDAALIMWHEDGENIAAHCEKIPLKVIFDNKVDEYLNTTKILET